MIYRILHIVIIILLWINLIPCYSQPEEGPESFIQNISLPGGLITDGINPEDIVFADNKYFVAGLGTVLVLNEELTVINTINLSERGQYGYEASTILAENPTHCLMAFNGSNKLFVISPDNEICIINTAGIGSLESQRIPKPTNVPSILFMNSIIRYDPVNDRLFWLITWFNCNNLSSPLNDYFLYHTIKDIEYSSYFNRLYVLAIGVNQLNAVYSGSCFGFEEPIPRWEAPAYCNAIKYNNLNQRLYVYSPFEWDVDFESHLSILDHNEEEIDDILLHNSQCVRYANPDLYNNLVVDPVTGYLLVPNGSHSNISVIRCPERFELTNRINWISFPRLDRNPINIEAIDSKVALENRIIPGPDNTFSGQMKYLAYDPGDPQDGDLTSIDKNDLNSPWDQANGLNEVYSNRGYQLQVTPDQKFIYFYGQIQDPDVPVEVEGTPVDRFSNWVGYYLTYPQSPFDAKPENVLENLTMISGQYWSCSRYNPLPIESGYDCWRCAVNQGRIEINYGDMVKLTSQANTSFTWQQNNSNEPSVEKLKSESFIYNEQYNYEALFIELDANDIPEEIGAFAGDSCVGATKVLPGDTTVLICAYTEGYEGEDITFEFSYATKTARINQPDYYVLNPGTGISERRRIKAGENQPCHFVSFKQKYDNQSNTFSNRLNCYPNPAGEAFSLSYFIPEDGYVKLEIMNPLGLIVLEKPFGYLTQGNHSFDIQTAGLPSGYYFVRLYSGKQIHIGTLLINR